MTPTAIRWLAWIDQQHPDYDADLSAGQVAMFVLEAAELNQDPDAWLSFRVPQFARHLQRKFRRVP